MPATQKTTPAAVAALRLDLPDPLPIALSVNQATQIAGVALSTMWEAVRDGSVESIKIRGRVLIPTIPFLKRFGIESSPVSVDPSSH